MLNPIKAVQKSIFIFLFLLIAFTGKSQSRQNLVQYAKPIMGTEKMGHTFPRATVPFGAV
jgi:putative alpha-1,2-mannosidase